MSGRRTRQTQPSPSSPAPDAGEQEEVGADLSWVLSAVESLTAQVQAVAKQQEEQRAGLVLTFAELLVGTGAWLPETRI